MLPFENLVLGGGGARCFWEAGVLHALRGAGLKPARIASVSGGALVAASFVADNVEALRSVMHEECKGLERNVRWRRFGDNRRLFPHMWAYTRAIQRSFDAEAIRKLRFGPPFTVQITRPPAWPPRMASLIADAVHEVERHVRQTPHGRWVARLGFQAEHVDAREVRDGLELAHLLAATGCVPPIIPLQRWAGRPALDGSLLSNAPVGPVRAAEETGEPTLVLTTRRYARWPRVPSRTYLMPSCKMQASKFDLTDPDELERAFRLGERDGKSFLRRRDARPDGGERRRDARYKKAEMSLIDTIKAGPAGRDQELLRSS